MSIANRSILARILIYGDIHLSSKTMVLTEIILKNH